MQLLELGTNKVLIDFTDSPKLYDFTPRFYDDRRQSYRRGDARLVSNDGRYKAELTFELRRLTQAEVAALEAIYRSREPFICVPDTVDEPEKMYIVRWASGFELQDTIKTDWTQGKSLTAVFVEVGSDANIFTPAYRIEIAGVDVTDRWVKRDGMIVGKQLEYPKAARFRSNEIRLNVDNEDGYFDYGNPNNLFVSNGHPAHGRGATVLIRLGLSKSELTPVFAGIVSEVTTSLTDTRAQLTVHDLSQKLSQRAIESFGEEITRRITDFDGVSVDYDDLDPIFYFPVGLRRIVRGSVSVIVHESGGDVAINIVDVVGTSGVLSNRNAEIDYGRGLIRFEAPPTDGADTEITATWKVGYQYKRPDFLIRSLLKHSGLQTELGITDDKAARFGIEQALISHPTDPSFSSHGRPYPQENGVVRWMRRQGGASTITRTRTIGSFNIEGALFHRGSIANSSSLAQIETQCVPANSRTLSSDLTSPSTTNFTEFVGENYIYRQYIVLQTPNRLTNVKVRFPNGVDDAALIAIYPANEDGSRASDTPLATLFQRSYDSGTVTVSDTISQSEWGSTERIRIEYFMIEIGGGQRGRWQFGYTEAGQAERVPQYITSSFPLVSYTETETETIRNPSVVWQMIQDQRFIEYDEHQDEYTEIATLPREEVGEGIVADDYGMLLEGESFSFPFPGNNQYSAGIDRVNNRFYVMDRNSGIVREFLVDGTFSRIVFDLTTSGSDMDIHDGNMYLMSPRGYPNGYFEIRLYDLTTGVQQTPSYRRSRVTGQSSTRGSIAVSDDRVFVWWINNIYVFDHSLQAQSTEQTTLRSALRNASITGGAIELAVNGSHLFVSNSARNDQNEVVIRNYAFTLAYVRDSESDFDIDEMPLSRLGGTAATDTRFYAVDHRLSQRDTDQQVYAYQLGTSIDFGGFVPFQFDSADGNAIYFLSANNTQGNAISESTLRQVKVYKLDKDAGTIVDLLNETTGQPQLSHPYKFPGQQVIYLCDNRKNFEVVQRNGKTLIFYRRVQASRSGIAYYNDTDGTLTDVYSENHSGSEDYGLPYSMDFALDIRNDGIYVYTFVVRYTLETDDDFNGGTLKVYRKRVEPNGTQTEIYSENFTKSSADEDYPVSVSDLILADDRSKFYFVLDWHGEGDRVGKAELCTIAKSGSGGRTVLKTYENPLLGARSPAKMGSRYFYLEGGWVRRPKSDPPADEPDKVIPDDQHFYPNEGGKLIEIESNDAVTDHGQVWRSATKQDHPDADDDSPIHDGWGLFNSPISNIEVDDRGNLHFVTGYGSPYNTDENLPFSSNREPVPALSNFQWLQWGKDLATKIGSFPTNEVKAWDLIQQLAQLMNWEIGFGPSKRKVEAIQAAHSSISDWGANASLFFRPRTILPAKLRASIGASGTPSTIALNDSGLPAEASEFPVPPSGERYAVIIDKELFTYTGVSPDSSGRRLTGVQRAQNGSTAAAHAKDAKVYFVDYFASGELGTTLVSIQSKLVDFVNLRNDVNVAYGEAVYSAKNQQSIDENGEFTFELSNSLLSRYDRVWAERIGDTYLDELSELKELLQFTLVFSPILQPGQLIVVYQVDRVRIDFKQFRLLQAQHHTHPRWQTGATALEIL